MDIMQIHNKPMYRIRETTRTQQHNARLTTTLCRGEEEEVNRNIIYAHDRHSEHYRIRHTSSIAIDTASAAQRLNTLDYSRPKA